MRSFPLTCLILASSIATVLGDTYTSFSTGLWDSAPENSNTWDPAGNPQTGTNDSVSILTGHTVIFSGASGVGLPGSGDLGVANGQTISINGGVLSQNPANYWIRIGHGSTGTLNINDGRFHFTNSLDGAAPNLQLGIRGGSGFVTIGDGVGDPGSAVLNLRDIIDGSPNAANVSLNLAAGENGSPDGLVGKIVINSDGVLEGDVRNTDSNNPHIRVGQSASAEQSSIVVNAGGQFRAHGNVEVGARPGANGLIHLNGFGARMDMDGGELTVGYDGTGTLLIDNGSAFSRTNTESERKDIYVGRRAAGNGTIIVQNGGQFLRGSGGNVGDLRIGLGATGSMIINENGLVQNDSTNWDWVGQDSGSNGTLTINAGGSFVTTNSANLVVGLNTGATGLVFVNGGNMSLSSGSHGEIRLGQNGTGTFRQVAGFSDIRAMIMAENDGNATFELEGGTMNVRAQFFLGGANGTSAGAGTATATQSGGSLTVNGAFVVGLAPGHTGNYSLSGGEVFHTGSDTSVGESGTGTFHVGLNGKFTDTTGGQFFVGRNEGSSGTLIVDGNLSRTATSGIRVGNGNSDGVDNTNGTGLLGGTGTIESNVRIGSHGTLTAGTSLTIGTLSLTGDLSFSGNGLLYANLGSAGSSDRINLTGGVFIETGAILGGTWGGGIPDSSSRYWLLVNDGDDFINGTFANVSLTSPNASLFPSADGWATIEGQEFAVFYNADFGSNSFTGGNDLLLAPVPEPSTALLLGCGAILGLSRRRRKNA